MATTLIYDRILEIKDMVYHVEQWTGTVEALEAQHPNHDIYLYEPPIVTPPVLVEGEEPVETPTVYPTVWTPVDPIAAIVIKQTRL
jgi:hypothetical protein